MKKWLALLLVIGTLIPAAMSTIGNAASVQNGYAPKPTCTDSLQVLIDQTAPGSTVEPRLDCIYREEVVIGSSITLDGQGEAEIRGSDIWSEWTPVDGVWVSTYVVPWFETEGTCDESSDGRCLWPEQVFFNGTALRQVGAGTMPVSGQFSLNDARNIVIADDPTDAMVEVTTRTRWIDVAANGVSITGFVMKHAASDAQVGAIRMVNVVNWTVEKSSLSDSHGLNVSFYQSPNGQLLDNEIFNAGQLGFGGVSDYLVVSGNSVHHNNTEEFSSHWESGGGKITNSSGILVDGNAFYLNNGPGIWCDIDCISTVISNNSVHHNSETGIFFEISDGAEITGNAVWENSWGEAHRGWGFDAGILVSSSRNAQVHDNVVAWNGDGIVVLSECRKFLADEVTCDLSHPWNVVIGNSVHDNVIVMPGDVPARAKPYPLGWLRKTLDEQGNPFMYMFSDEAQNSGENNRYWIPQPEGSSSVYFSWGDENYIKLDAFNATRGEENGTYVSDEEMRSILEDQGIPPEPEDHSVPIPVPDPVPPGVSETVNGRSG